MGEEEEEIGPREQLPIITISRELASGGREIAEQLNRMLGWELWDREIVDEIATNANVHRKMVEMLDERHQTEIEAILRAFSKEKTIDRYVYRRHLVETIFTIAQRGRAIILGRGANFILDCTRCTLAVRVVASMEIRVARLMDRENISESEARRRILRSDRQRRDFVKKMFGLDISDPIHYDLTIKTDHIGIEEAANVIITALRAKFPQAVE
jgi:cytidylate kinase